MRCWQREIQTVGPGLAPAFSMTQPDGGHPKGWPYRCPLNIAPLWELVPWTEAKKYWDELLVGKCEWSSIAKQLCHRGTM